MDFENIKELLIGYIPMLSMLLGFAATAFGILKNFKSVLSKSSLDNFKEDLKECIKSQEDKIDELTNLAKCILEENKQLKERNLKLLGELKRISDYEEE